MLEFLTASGLAFGLIFLAEIGDKSQLVCMALASRLPARWVFAGAVSAFLLLNLIAVLIGAGIGHLFPPEIPTLIAAILFAAFGVQSLRSAGEETSEKIETSGRRAFWSSFALIFMAELGDKTQLAVAALAANEIPAAIWAGASAALILTTALGVYAGKRFLAKLDQKHLHQISGILFITFAVFAFFSLFWT